MTRIDCLMFRYRAIRFGMSIAKVAAGEAATLGLGAARGWL